MQGLMQDSETPLAASVRIVGKFRSRDQSPVHIAGSQLVHIATHSVRGGLTWYHTVHHYANTAEANEAAAYVAEHYDNKPHYTRTA